MKTILALAAAAVLLVVGPSTCLALWEIEIVTPERAKELGMEVRTTAAGPRQVRVELEFKVAGELADFSRVDLRVGQGDNPPVTAPLKEDRSKVGIAAVSFSANRATVETLSLWVMVPGSRGGAIYDVRVKDFVELKEVR